MFKMAKKWGQAGEAFLRAAELHLKDGANKHEAGTKYVEASTCYRKVDAKGK